MNNTIYIYGLVDPRTQELRYVGKTNNIKQRYSFHLTSRKRTHVSNWIKNLKTSGIKPEIFVIEESDKDNWREAEKFHINYFRYIGANLVNLADGGGGISGYNHSQQARQRMSDSWKARPRAQEQLRQIQELRTGIKFTEEHRKKLAEAKLGRKWSEASRIKVSKTRRGKPWTKARRDAYLRNIQP